MDTKPRAVSDTDSPPIRCFMAAGHIGDYNGVAATLDSVQEWRCKRLFLQTGRSKQFGSDRTEKQACLTV